MGAYKKVMRHCDECKHFNKLDGVPGNFCSCFNIVIADDYARLCKQYSKDNGSE